MTAFVSARRLRLELTCRCVATLGRRLPDERFVLAGFERAQGCSVHSAMPAAGTEIVGFGPYPVWSADRALRVASVPEAGGMMEGEHAFILDEQFCFLAAEPAPRPIGPIRDARWQGAPAAAH